LLSCFCFFLSLCSSDHCFLPSREFRLWICRCEDLRIWSHCSAQQPLNVLCTLSLHLHPCRNFPFFFTLTLTPLRLYTRPRRLRRKISLPLTHYLHLFFLHFFYGFLLFFSVFCAIFLPSSTHIQTYTYAIQYTRRAAWLGSFFCLICDRFTADVSSILLFPFFFCSSQSPARSRSTIPSFHHHLSHSICGLPRQHSTSLISTHLLIIPHLLCLCMCVPFPFPSTSLPPTPSYLPCCASVVTPSFTIVPHYSLLSYPTPTLCTSTTTPITN